LDIYKGKQIFRFEQQALALAHAQRQLQERQDEPDIVEVEQEDLDREERRPFPRPAEGAVVRGGPAGPRANQQSCAQQARGQQPPAPGTAAAAQEVGAGATEPAPFRFGLHNVSSEAYLEQSWDSWTEEDIDNDRARAATFLEKYGDQGLQKVFKQLLKSVHGVSLDLIQAMNRANAGMVGGNIANPEAFAQLMRAADATITGM